MAMKYLGETLDIHAGGIDLTFPHHENEIAQSEALTGKQFARFWLHSEHLIVEGQKMSKSLGNFFTLRDLLERGYKPEVDPLSAHRPCRIASKLNFTFDGLKAAATAIDRLRILSSCDWIPTSFPGRERSHRSAHSGRAASVSKRAWMMTSTPRKRWPQSLNTSATPIRPWMQASFKSGNLAGGEKAVRAIRLIFDVLRPSVEEGGITEAEIDALIAERTQAREGPEFQARRRDPGGTARSRHRYRRHQGRSALETQMKIETKAVHAGDRKKPGAMYPVTTPIYTASTYIYDDTEQLDKVFGEEIEGQSLFPLWQPHERRARGTADIARKRRGLARLRIGNDRAACRGHGRADGPAEVGARGERDLRRDCEAADAGHGAVRCRRSTSSISATWMQCSPPSTSTSPAAS